MAIWEFEPENQKLQQTRRLPARNLNQKIKNLKKTPITSSEFEPKTPTFEN